MKSDINHIIIAFPSLFYDFIFIFIIRDIKKEAVITDTTFYKYHTHKNNFCQVLLRSSIQQSKSIEEVIIMWFGKGKITKK